MSKSIHKLSDEELVILIGRGGRHKDESFTELYSRYSNRIYLYCRKMLGDGTFAEDIFQDVFINFLKAVENGANITNAPGYLIRTARNLTINHINKQKANLTVLDEEKIADVYDAIENGETQQLVEYALSMLSDEFREVFVLQAYEGMSYKEISEVTSLPISTIRNRVVRAKHKLRELLSPYIELCKNKRDSHI